MFNLYRLIREISNNTPSRTLNILIYGWPQDVTVVFKSSHTLQTHLDNPKDKLTDF